MSSIGTTTRRALVIVPTFNEADSIAAVVQRLFDSSAEVDMLVVDDDSPDGTAMVVTGLQQEHDRLHLIERPGRAGLASAYLEGFRWAFERDYDVVIEMDADLSHDPKDVPRLLKALEGADAVLGSRYVPGGEVRNWPWFRRALSRAGNSYARLCLGFHIRDATSGFRAYRADALRSIELGSIRSEGYAFQVEMVRRLWRQRLRVKEIPIAFIDRQSGKSKMSRRIVFEALALVTIWGLRDRLGRRLPPR